MDRPVDSSAHRRRRWLWGGLGLVGVGVAAALIYPKASSWFEAERSFELSRLRVAQVVQGDLERDVSVQGQIVAAFHPTSFSPAAGTVRLAVRAGDLVAEGQRLATVESPEIDSLLERERSSLRSLESGLERQRILARQRELSNQQRVDLAELARDAAERALARAERSRAEGILNDVDYEIAQDDRRRTELEVDHARQDAELERETLEFDIRDRELEVERQRLMVADLERQIEELSIRAPVAGRVSRLDVEDRDAVIEGQSLVTVVDLSAFEIEVGVPEVYADELAPGTPAEIQYSGDVYPGELTSLSPEVDGSQVRGVVQFAGRSPDGLRQNQRLTVRLVLDTRSDVLKVARGPFLDGGGGRSAYVIEGDLARRRPIAVGAASVSEVEIRSGLEPGETIVISDTTRFEEAETVYLRR